MNDIQCGRTLTYHDFFEKFNAISQGYHACPATLGGETIGVVIVSNLDGLLMASLGSESRTWAFNDSAFDWKELDLMTKLAATSPELRGGYSDD